jgi:NCAIR mutase (PurE)-related protein
MKFVQIRKNILHAGVAVALVAGMATTLPSAVAGGTNN